VWTSREPEDGEMDDTVVEEVVMSVRKQKGMVMVSAGPVGRLACPVMAWSRDGEGSPWVTRCREDFAESDPGRWPSTERHRLYEAEHDTSQQGEDWQKVQVSAMFVDKMESMKDVRGPECLPSEFERRRQRDPMALDHHRIVWVSVADLLATEDGADWIDQKQAGRFKMAVVLGIAAMSRRGLPVLEKEMQRIMEEHDGTSI